MPTLNIKIRIFTKMKIVRKGNDELHVSEEIMDELKMRDNDYYLEMSIGDSIQEFLSNPLHKEYEELYRQKNNLSGCGILFAHGDSYQRNKWAYQDAGKWKNVQKWINENDGKFSALILKCCNPGSAEIKSKKSIVLMPNQEFSNVLHNIGEVQIEIYAPGKGYIDEYVIEDETKKLQSILGCSEIKRISDIRELKK